MISKNTIVAIFVGITLGLMICTIPFPESDPTIDAVPLNIESVETTEMETAEIEETTVNSTTTEPTITTIATTESSWKSLGTFKLTAYCPNSDCSGEWGNMTSTGVRAKEGRTIAVDPNVIPYGSVVSIDGHIYIAEDCGGSVKGNVIDIYFDTHEEAVAFGVQYAEVELFVGG